MKAIFFNLFLVCIVPFQACCQGKWKTLKPIKDTSFICELRVFHAECTSCEDIEIDSGEIRSPDPLMLKLHTQPPTDLANGQWKKLFGSYKSKKYGYAYLVRGKVQSITDLGSYTKAGTRYIPVFEVYQYKFLKKEYEYSDWHTDNDATSED